MATYLIDRQRNRKRRTVALILLGVGLIGGIVGVYAWTLQTERDPATSSPVATSEATNPEPEIATPEDLFSRAEVPAVQLSEVFDNQRTADIDTIGSLLGGYFRDNGRYPRMTQMNSDQFRAEAFTTVPATTFQDPEDPDTITVFTRTPQERVYSYNPVDANGYTCEPINRHCTQYTLSVILSDGSVYSLSSVD
jgi:hypothetical protein